MQVRTTRGSRCRCRAGPRPGRERVGCVGQRLRPHAPPTSCCRTRCARPGRRRGRDRRGRSFPSRRRRRAGRAARRTPPRSIEDRAGRHGHLRAESTVAQVRPVAHPTVVHLDEIGQAVSGHVGDADAVAGPGECGGRTVVGGIRLGDPPRRPETLALDGRVPAHAVAAFEEVRIAVARQIDEPERNVSERGAGEGSEGTERTPAIRRPLAVIRLGPAGRRRGSVAPCRPGRAWPGRSRRRRSSMAVAQPGGRARTEPRRGSACRARRRPPRSADPGVPRPRGRASAAEPPLAAREARRESGRRRWRRLRRTAPACSQASVAEGRRARTWHRAGRTPRAPPPPDGNPPGRPRERGRASAPGTAQVRAPRSRGT